MYEMTNIHSAENVETMRNLVERKRGEAPIVEKSLLDTIKSFSHVFSHLFNSKHSNSMKWIFLHIDI